MAEQFDGLVWIQMLDADENTHSSVGWDREVLYSRNKGDLKVKEPSHCL